MKMSGTHRLFSHGWGTEMKLPKIPKGSRATYLTIRGKEVTIDISRSDDGVYLSGMLHCQLDGIEITCSDRTRPDNCDAIVDRICFDSTLIPLFDQIERIHVRRTSTKQAIIVHLRNGASIEFLPYGQITWSIEHKQIEVVPVECPF